MKRGRGVGDGGGSPCGERDEGPQLASEERGAGIGPGVGTERCRVGTQLPATGLTLTCRVTWEVLSLL